MEGRTFRVRKRDGRTEEFNEARILLALECAFKAHHGLSPEKHLPDAVQAAVKKCADHVVERVLSRAVKGEELEVERIQDAAEDQLMTEGHLEVARRYILYREERRRTRVERELRAVFQESKPPPPVPKTPTAAPPEERPRAGGLSAQEWLRSIYGQALPKPRPGETLQEVHRRHFDCCLNEGEYLRLVDAELLEFDSARLARGLRLERDQTFTAAGLEALHDLYLPRENGRRLQTPQHFWMKIAMGLALNEGAARETRALEFYEVLSTFRFVPSDLILRHAGSPHPQLSACHGAASASDLEHVTLQPGGPACSWLEPWHRDVLAFLARPQPGGAPSDPQLNKGLWVPDLFMKRLRQQGSWTIFDPGEADGLRRCQGAEFEARYLEYEQQAARGGLRFSRRINAADLWRQVLVSLLQTGQPWLGFKDAVNTRSTRDHRGPVCGAGVDGDVLPKTFPYEGTACPLGAINLAAHLTDRGVGLDVTQLRATVTAAVRMLDNAVDLSAYPAEPLRAASREQRPIGLGVAGFADALDRLQLQPASAAAADFADWSMELVSYFAILASAELAAERGPCPGYAASKWSRGLLPLDTLALLSSRRGLPVDVNAAAAQDWEPVRAMIRRHGMRHCATTAVASCHGPARVAGLAPFPDAGATDPFWLIECAARRQKWIDLGHTLDLPAPERDLAKISRLYTQAWEKGLKTIHQLLPAAQLQEHPGVAGVPAAIQPPPEMAAAPV
ncbi:MAG: ATP cone domain-containing protein [Verrucomicrobiota bacterium]